MQGSLHYPFGYAQGPVEMTGWGEMGGVRSFAGANDTPPCPVIKPPVEDGPPGMGDGHPGSRMGHPGWGERGVVL
jgi:hypothetical protein